MGSMRNPLVSVVIPTYNCAAFVGEAIQSVLEQSVEAYEIIVVDDGSTDDTAATLAPYGGRIRCLRQNNRGVAAARNLGVEAARGEVIGFLDSDDRWRRDKLERQLNLLGNHREIDVVFSGHENIGGPVAGFNEYKAPDLTRVLAVAPLGPHEFMVQDDDLFEKILRYYLLLTSTVVIRKSCLDRVGGFDTELPIAEDTQLWLRLAKRGRLAFIDAPLVERRARSESLTADEAGFIRHIVVMYHRLGRWLPDLTAKEREHVALALDYWYAKAHRLHREGDHRFGARFFLKSFFWDPRLASARFLVVSMLPEFLVGPAWGLDRRLRWYASKMDRRRRGA